MSKRVQVAEETIEILSQWYGPDLPRQVDVLRGSITGWLFGLSGQAAVTINRKVHLTPRANDLESKSGIVPLGHELFFFDHVSGWLRRASWERLWNVLGPPKVFQMV